MLQEFRRTGGQAVNWEDLAILKCLNFTQSGLRIQVGNRFPQNFHGTVPFLPASEPVAEKARAAVRLGPVQTSSLSPWKLPGPSLCRWRSELSHEVSLYGCPTPPVLYTH